MSEIQQAARTITDAVSNALTALEQSQKEEHTAEIEEDDLSFGGIAM